MKNLTVTLPEDVLARARVAAAQEGKSMSRFIAGLVEQRIGRSMTQLEALEAFLSGPGLPGLAGSFNREELYAGREAELLRRHQRAALPEGPAGTGKAGQGAALAHPARGK